ncbi:MAG TPA: SAM-dependent methyltransferase [Kofleriaceae bacterium]|nr:SAM-dependent methyltransferase [Kofleriaceae bacterium]
MREGTPSRTAAWVAAARSMGTLLPPEARLADDPYGLRFAAPLESPPPGAGLAVRWFLPMRVWVMYMQVRTRILDDILLAFVERGGRQVVLLGAGYDCRALRFADRLRGATVFEVDHPATQGHKRRVVGSPPGVQYLAWNFEQHPMSELPAALAGAGHDASKPTLTIWEGVTMYLTPEAIDASVRAVRSFSSTGESELALTYFTRDLIDRPDVVRKIMAAVVKSSGEPFRFGWEPRELPSWFASRGFALERDVSIADEAKRLLPKAWARGVGEGGQRIALVRAAAESIAVASAR